MRISRISSQNRPLKIQGLSDAELRCKCTWNMWLVTSNWTLTSRSAAIIPSAPAAVSPAGIFTHRQARLATRVRLSPQVGPCPRSCHLVNDKGRWTNPRSGSRVRSAALACYQMRGAAGEPISLLGGAGLRDEQVLQCAITRAEVSAPIGCVGSSLRWRSESFNRKSRLVCNVG